MDPVELSYTLIAVLAFLAGIIVGYLLSILKDLFD